MPYITVDHAAENRKALARRVEILSESAHEIPVLPGEDIALQYYPDGLAVRVGVRSWRPEELLEKIHKAAFPMFHMPAIRFEGDRYWTTFRIAFN